MRLQHAIQKTVDLSLNYALGPEHTGIIIQAMIEGVISEGVDQIEDSLSLRMTRFFVPSLAAG